MRQTYIPAANKGLLSGGSGVLEQCSFLTSGDVFGQETVSIRPAE